MNDDMFTELFELLLDAGREKHAAALKVISKILDDEGDGNTRETSLESLLRAFHRELQARQLATSRNGDYLDKPPDPSKPPGQSYYPVGALVYCSHSTMSAYQAIDLVAPNHRYRYRLRRQVQNDLARFSAYFGGLSWLQIYSGRAPLPVFERPIVISWLEAGGRAWILAELAKHSDRRVVAFRGRG